jgi:hypothetical protein
MPRLNLPRAATPPVLALFAATSVFVMVPIAHAEALPASVRACAQESDSLKRLVCYDREVARYTNQPAAGAPSGGPPPPALKQQPSPQSPPSSVGDTAQAAAVTPTTARHISAKIVKVEDFPDEVIVHLDNGQVWQQLEEATTAVNLHAGDTVTIDREMAAYWLSAKGGSVMKVRQKIK